MKKVIGLVRLSGRGPAAGDVMDLSDRLHLERLDRLTGAFGKVICPGCSY